MFKRMQNFFSFLIIGMMIVTGTLSFFELNSYAEPLKVNWMISPQYDEAAPFYEGIAAVKKEGKWGYIDINGNQITKFEFDYASPFSGGVAKVGIEENGGYRYMKYGLIDKSGKLILPVQYPIIGEFSNGVAVISKDISTFSISSKYGYVNKMGKIVLPLEYSYVTEFKDGLAIVNKNKTSFIIDEKMKVLHASANSLEYKNEGMFLTTDGKKYGIIDKNGKNILPFAYDEIQPFSEGKTGIRLNKKWGYADKTGKIIVSPKYDGVKGTRYVVDIQSAFLGGFRDGLAAVLKNDENGFVGWGFIDVSGKEVIKCQYSDVYPFNGGLALVQRQTSGLYAIIDKLGNELSSYKYTDIKPFEGNFAKVTGSHTTWHLNQGLVNKLGQEVLTAKYFSLGDYSSDGMIQVFDSDLAVEHNHDYGFANETGLVIPIQFSGVGDFKNGYAPVRKNFDWGYVDKKGNIIIDFQFDNAGSVGNGVAPVKEKNGKWGFIRMPEKPSDWAVNDVNRATSLNLVPDSITYDYTKGITRADFCALGVQLYETVKGTQITERATFSDTSDVNVQKMAGLGIVGGVGNGKFAPNDTLTREQAATMLTKLLASLNKTYPENQSTFVDNNTISSWARIQVGTMQTTGVMGGTGNNKFSPKDKYTREQSIVTLLKVYDLVK